MTRTIQYVVRLSVASRAQLEAVQGYESERLGRSLSIGDILRAIIEEAALQRGVSTEEANGAFDHRRGLRVEVRRRKPLARKAKTGR